jgi:hypothetical protein
MSDAAVLLRRLSEPWPPGEYVKTAINRAAKLAGLSYWRAFDLWYGKARRVEPHEIEQIEAALLKKNRREIRDEVRDIRLQIARIEARLSSTDEEFHREDIAALRAATGQSR